MMEDHLFKFTLISSNSTSYFKLEQIIHTSLIALVGEQSRVRSTVIVNELANIFGVYSKSNLGNLTSPTEAYTKVSQCIQNFDTKLRAKTNLQLVIYYFLFRIFIYYISSMFFIAFVMCLFVHYRR